MVEGFLFQKAILNKTLSYSEDAEPIKDIDIPIDCNKKEKNIVKFKDNHSYVEKSNEIITDYLDINIGDFIDNNKVIAIEKKYDFDGYLDHYKITTE